MFLRKRLLATADGICHSVATVVRVRKCVVTDDKDDNVVDMRSARNRLEPVRKEKAAKDLRKQFQKAMGWNSAPKPKKPGGSKGPKGGKGKKK